MSKMHELLQRIQIKPTQSNTTYSMAYYYSEISEVNRLHYDSQNTSKQPGVFIFTRMFPIAATDADIELMKEFQALSQRWMDIALVAPNPVSIPQCLRCCCCRFTKRTSCGFFYKLLFGHIK